MSDHDKIFSARHLPGVISSRRQKLKLEFQKACQFRKLAQSEKDKSRKGKKNLSNV